MRPALSGLSGAEVRAPSSPLQLKSSCKASSWASPHCDFRGARGGPSAHDLTPTQPAPRPRLTRL